MTKPPFPRRRTSSDIGGRAWAYTNTDDADEEEEASENDFSNLPGTASRQQTRNEERQGLLQRDGAPDIGQMGSPSKKKRKNDAIDLTGWKLVKKVDFIVLFLIMTMITGTGLLVINVSEAKPE